MLSTGEASGRGIIGSGEGEEGVLVVVALEEDEDELLDLCCFIEAIAPDTS
jgi:hypothetical protein